jgi:hypothetical protein
MTDITDTNTYAIPNGKLAEFEANIAKMNRKAVKLGCEPITIEKLATIEVTKSHTTKFEGIEKTKKYKVPATVIALFGKAPVVGGFEFIARIEYLSDSESMLFHTVPGTGTKIDERFRGLKPGVCEHCKLERVRKDTFVVRNVATGEQKQVGRQCLADYTGIHTIENLAGKAAWLHTFATLRDEIDSYWTGGGYFLNKVDTTEALALTSAYIEMFGWVPKSACFNGGTPTAGYVAAHFSAGDFSKDEKETMAAARALVESNPKHTARAAEVMAWIKNSLADTARSDYELNLVTLATKELTETKHLGIVCSAVSAWQRATNRAVEYAKRIDETKNSKPVGTVGERLRDIPVKVTFVKAMEATQWGASTLIKFLDQAGNVLTWFASGDRDYEVGQEIKITGTVKGHKAYNGVTETQISRVV